MEYYIKSFIESIKQTLHDNFPYSPEFYANNTGYMQTKSAKHPNTPFHVRHVALDINPIEYISEDLMYFDLGNDFAERKYPYYHILEDMPIIRKRGQASEKSKGSQMDIALMSNRDFNLVTFNGKTFTKEYNKNVRGKRKQVVDNSTRYVSGVKINSNSNSYENKHYHYIERIMNVTLPFVAETNGLKMGRTAISGFEEEYIQDYYNVGITSEEQMTDFVSRILGEY